MRDGVAAKSFSGSFRKSRLERRYDHFENARIALASKLCPVFQPETDLARDIVLPSAGSSIAPDGP
jgi:hypothetical protein